MVMKKLDIFIRPEKLEPVKEALFELGLRGMTIYEVKGHGHQRGMKFMGRAGEFCVEWIDKLKIEIVVNGSVDLERIIEGIREKAATGKPGDGKIFVYTIEDAVRIRTGERGEKVL